MTRNREKRRGGTLVEGALVLLTTLVTLIGILDVGQYLFLQQTLRERARAAVRYAAVNSYDPGVITNVVLYNSPSAPSGGGPGLMGMTASMVNVARHDAGTPADRVEIVIANYPMKFYSPFLAGTTIEPVFRAVMPVESLGASD